VYVSKCMCVSLSVCVLFSVSVSGSSLCVPAAYVLAICGPPEYQLIEEVPARARTVTGFSRFIGIAVSEQWIYDRGRGKFPVVLEFHDGKLRRIEFLPHRS